MFGSFSGGRWREWQDESNIRLPLEGPRERRPVEMQTYDQLEWELVQVLIMGQNLPMERELMRFKGEPRQDVELTSSKDSFTKNPIPHHGQTRPVGLIQF